MEKPLSPLDRAEYYRQRGEEALDRAADAGGNEKLRDGYLELAQEWFRMADELLPKKKT